MTDALNLLKTAGVENAEKFAPIFEEERKIAQKIARDPDAAPLAVLFVCGQNAGRSQLAEALFKKRLGELSATGEAVGFSAGSVPAKALNPIVREVLQELDVDTSSSFPKPISKEVAGAASVIVTMGCDTSCPYFAGKKTIDWEIPDAKGKDKQGIQDIGKSVSKLVDDLIHDLLEIQPPKTTT